MCWSKVSICSMWACHKIYLESDLGKGSVKVGLRAQLLIEGVTLLLGNDLAGGKMLINPEVIDVPLPENTVDLALKFPNIFFSLFCDTDNGPGTGELFDSFLVHCSASPSASPDVSAPSDLLQMDS